MDLALGEADTASLSMKLERFCAWFLDMENVLACNCDFRCSLSLSLALRVREWPRRLPLPMSSPSPTSLSFSFLSFSFSFSSLFLFSSISLLSLACRISSALGLVSRRMITSLPISRAIWIAEIPFGPTRLGSAP